MTKQRVHFNKTPAEIIQERRARSAVQAEQMAQLKQPRPPLGGAPQVKIPPLNAEPLKSGGTMQEQAEILQDPTSPLSPAYNPQIADLQRRGGFAALPPQARQQPGFMPGVGSMVEGNQPFIGQRNPDGFKPVLSEETKRGLAALDEFHRQAAAVQQSEVQKPAAEATPAAPRPMSAPSAEEGLDEDLERTRREVEDMLKTTQNYNVLNDPERKKRIESSLKAMDVTEIIVHGELRQTVSVLGNLSITFRTVSTEEDLAVKRMMYGEKGGELYMLEKYNSLQLTLALVAVNEHELPTHLDKDGRFDSKLFEDKYRKVMLFPVQLVADLCVQYAWFDERVRAMLAGQTEALKNT